MSVAHQLQKIKRELTTVLTPPEGGVGGYHLPASARLTIVAVLGALDRLISYIELSDSSEDERFVVQSPQPINTPELSAHLSVPAAPAMVRADSSLVIDLDEDEIQRPGTPNMLPPMPPQLVRQPGYYKKISWD